MIFAPSGESVTIQATNKSQTYELPAFPTGDIKAVRLLPTRVFANTFMFVRFGDANTSVTPENGMPIPSIGESFLAIPAAETHIAILILSGNPSSIVLTSGLIKT